MRKRKKGVVIASVFAVLLVFSFSFCAYGRFEESRGEVVIKTLAGEVLVKVEAVDTPQNRARGLMFQKSLPPEEGMFFVFEKEGRRNFWMKNMLIPLDIIFISADKRIVGIAKESEPCISGEVCPHISSAEPAQYVLEVNAGFVDAHEVLVGDVLQFEYPFRRVWISCGSYYLK